MTTKLFLLMTAVSMAWAYVSHKIPVHLDPASCPPTFKNHPLILVSMDGFRADYMTRGLTPNLQKLSLMGVRAPYMKPSYPTITFPNHYTIATGMYPASHGIIANKFYDPVFKSEFRIGKPESLKRRWWGGEPIWKTAENQGKRAATFFWPGSEVDGNQPTYWFNYNMSIPYEDRVDQVLAWLDLPPWERPDFMTLYMDEPDSMGHDFGPNSPQVDRILMHVDAVMGRLLEGLVARNLLSCVNLLVVADHGMAEAGQERVLRLDRYIPNLVNRTRFWDGIFGRMTPNDRSQKTKVEMLNALSCKRPELRVYEKTTLPARWHMGNQRRVEDIVVDLDVGYTVAGDATFRADAGDHGYDNFFASMNAMFIAHGPEFRRNVEIEAFQNIELYNLMCHLLGVKPAPNNGTWGALNSLLVNPPQTPQTHLEDPPPRAIIPSEKMVEYYKKEAQCEGDLLQDDEWLEALEEAQEEASELTDYHLPWGFPQMGQARNSALLLVQPDFISAYSPLVKMPLWTSFTLDWKNRGTQNYPWKSDIRLMANQGISCNSYQSLFSQKISPQPLFPPEFSSGQDCSQLPYLISNAVPFTHDLKKRWQELLKLVKKWKHSYGTVNVITGPVFDYDADTFADNLDVISHGEKLPVPTHMFMVVSRCEARTGHVTSCPHTLVDAIAFIYPQSLFVSNCLDAERFAREFSATVQDVEKITGLKFYSEMHYDDQVRLQVRIHSNIWGSETWWNRLHSDFFQLF
ncbi:venom phosphodiesterase 2-like [Panulirus ornatus]|uniref:venom phosphodiesterase 2-like n=1 Tax=Panulirus ornatus TaxID=150431 RepID=UPI003A8462B5